MKIITPRTLPCISASSKMFPLKMISYWYNLTSLFYAQTFLILIYKHNQAKDYVNDDNQFTGKQLYLNTCFLI